MPGRPTSRPLRRIAGAFVALSLTCVTAACGATEESNETPTTQAAGGGLFDVTKIHDITVSFAPADYDAMIKTYAASQKKDWIRADVTIDGVSFPDAGMRLKGNSSLFGVGRTDDGGQAPRGPGGDASAESPQGLPWLVRLDRNVDGQAYHAVSEFVVRSSSTETALNETVALELLAAAGMPTQKSTHVRFSVNGSGPELRLVIENPNDEWEAESFDSEGILYKAEAGGDYSYRGDSADAYKEIFDQESGGDTDLTPLIEFLRFINESDDASFAAELPKRLDVNAFAKYLAFQELIDNFDDIDGPGNNSYLRYDKASGQFMIISWDHNLAFGAMAGGGRGGFPGGAPPGGTMPSFPGATGSTPGSMPPNMPAMPPGGFPAAPGGDGEARQGQPPGFPGGGMPGRSNILVQRFQANAQFKALYDEAVIELRASLYGNGKASEILDRRSELIRSAAADLVDAQKLDAEIDAVRDRFSTS